MGYFVVTNVAQTVTLQDNVTHQWDIVTTGVQRDGQGTHVIDVIFFHIFFFKI